MRLSCRFLWCCKHEATHLSHFSWDARQSAKQTQWRIFLFVPLSTSEKLSECSIVFMFVKLACVRGFSKLCAENAGYSCDACSSGKKKSNNSIHTGSSLNLFCADVCRCHRRFSLFAADHYCRCSRDHILPLCSTNALFLFTSCSAFFLPCLESVAICFAIFYLFSKYIAGHTYRIVPYLLYSITTDLTDIVWFSSFSAAHFFLNIH